MNKQDLANAIASAADVSKKVALDMLEAFESIVTKTLVEGGEVSLTGFGTFSVSQRKARMGVNPQKPSEKIQIPAVKVPKFKAGKSLKDAVK
jgi:DNA-binding protein HU-beta